MDDVLTILTDLFGPPTSDEIHESTWGEEAPFGYFRGVRWWSSSLKLYVEFIDWDINHTPLDTPVFSYWTAGQGVRPLQTIEGVGPGTPWSQAAEIYGDRAKTSPEPEQCGNWWNFVIDGHTGAGFPESFAAVHGILDGDPTNPETSINWMATGLEAFPQGC